MTNWLPDLNEGGGPLYMRLAERIEGDISSGVLPAGAKLPPQRDLAYDLGVTIGTVGRAYAVVRERGLVSGEVGRGTFVLVREDEKKQVEIALPPSIGGTRFSGATSGKLVMDSTSAPEVGQNAAIERVVQAVAREFPAEVIDYTRSVPARWREAGSRWLSVSGWVPDAAGVVPTIGVHAAVMAVVGAVTAPGDKIAFETLTYSSIARSVNVIGRRTVLFATDQHGPVPEDFERLCAQQHPKLAFLIPTLHNPTLTVMPESRRRAIAEIARRYNVWLIEDSIYGAFLREQPAPLSTFAPERTFHVGGLSKTVAAGIRGGWVSCPANTAGRVQVAHKMVTGGISFLLAELSARMVLSGDADAIRDTVRDEIAARHAMVRRTLDGFDFCSNAHCPFIWLKLPEPWLSGTFKAAAANEGVMIDDEDEYKPGRSDEVHHRVRVGFSSLPKRDAVDRGLGILRRLLENAGAGYDTYG
ncbi:MAG: PLP-dependent aminotransferase family protein [Rhizobiaceae bacterium]|nr:PLP-dependent aminotransferase family protein [Rhizobiaceae bacterium]